MDTPKYTPVLDEALRHQVELLDSAAREFFEERAGIIEFEGGLSRAEAERRAYVETIGRYGQADKTHPSRVQLSSKDQK